MKVRDVFYSLTLKVNPKVKESGAMFTPATVGFADGDRYTAQQMLDILNEGRFTLINALKTALADNELAKELALTVKRIEVSFHYETGGYAVAPFPSDYIKFISLASRYNIPVTILPNSLLGQVTSWQNPHFLNTQSQYYAFIQGDKVAYYGFYIDTLNPYWLMYYGVTPWSLTDVTGGEASEIFYDDLIPMLFQICEAIANEAGSAEVNGLARMLVAQKKGSR